MDREYVFLIERYYEAQKHRMAVGSQILALKKAKKPVNPLDIFFDRFETVEKEMAKYVEKAVKKHAMWKWLKTVKGIGPILGAALVASIDIAKAQHASSVWKYCGLAVVDGRGERKVTGKKLEYNPFCKMTCWKIGESFVKAKGPYRQIYDSSKEFYTKKFLLPKPKVCGLPKHKKDEKVPKTGSPCTKGHVHNMAKRRAVKLFLADFWAEWRKLEGLPVSEPYAHRGLASA